MGGSTERRMVVRARLVGDAVRTEVEDTGPSVPAGFGQRTKAPGHGARPDDANDAADRAPRHGGA